LNSRITYYLHTVYVWLMALLGASMCFNVENINISGIIIGLLAAIIIIHFIITKQRPSIASKEVFIFMLLFFALYALGVLYSNNQHEAKFNLEKKLSLAIIPTLFLVAPKLNAREQKKILFGFVSGCMLVCLFCLGVAIKNYLVTKDITFFYYHSLSINAGMHAGYLAMYLCFSVGILLYMYFRNVSELAFLKKVVYAISILFMSLCIFLLSARLQLIILMFEIIVYCIIYFNAHKSMLRSVGIACGIAVLAMGAALILPGTRERIKEAINYNNEYGLSKKWGEKQMRSLIWRSAWQAATEKPLIGTGSGDVVDDLEAIYKKNDFISLTYFKNTRFNAHDQYLETLIGTGLIGLITLLAIFFFMIKSALKEKNHLLIMFTLIFAMSCITESMLERQNGIIFFAFYSMLLLQNVWKRNAT
jgi:O-antigen ligase